MYPDKTKMESLTQAVDAAEVRGRSLWTDARVRFMRNKAAVGGLVVLIGILLFALFGSFLLELQLSLVLIQIQRLIFLLEPKMYSVLYQRVSQFI